MKMRKLNPRIPIVFLVLIVSVFISMTPATQVWAVQSCLEYDVQMRDGVLLYTRVFLPDPAVWGPGPYPTIVSTTPYGISTTTGITGFQGRGKCSTVLPVAQATNGYAYVYQDNRGRYLSGGVWTRTTDGIDGYDTIEWAAKQYWCNGKIGMTGASALGVNTYMTAGQKPPHLVAVLPLISSANRLNDYVYEGQAVQYEATLAWTLGQVPALSASHISSLNLTSQQLTAAQADWTMVNSDVTSHLGSPLASPPNPPGSTQPLPWTSTWWMHLPLSPFAGISPFLSSYWDVTFSHPSKDGWRDSFDVRDKIHVPGLHWGGWYDIYSRGILGAYQHLQKRLGHQKLLMTNGVHRTVGTKFPPNNNPYYPWFDYWLKGIDNGIMDEPPIVYYRMEDTTTAPGTGEWRYADQWPLPDVEKKTYYLHSDGTLSYNFPKHKEASTSYNYDPKTPVPSMGGRNLYIPAGAMDQSSVEPPNRSDVLIYTSDVLKNDVEISGRVKVFLHASSNCKDTDFTAKLIDVYPDGKKILILDGVIRARYRESPEHAIFMHPGEIYEFIVDLGNTSQVFKAGHRIQVDISSSNFPRRDRNPNTGHVLYTFDTNNDAVVATNTIYHDPKHPSYVVLPIVHPKTRIFKGQASIRIPALTYEGPAELHTLGKGVYFCLTNLNNRWVKWDIEHDWDTRFVDYYLCDGKLGKLSVWVHAEGKEPYFAFAWGKGVLFEGSPK